MKKIFYLLISLFLSESAYTQLTYSNVTFPVNSNTIPDWGIACSYYDPSSQTLYVGGGFTTLGTTPRSRIAAIDAATGAIKSWAPVINNGTVYSIKKKGNLIYVAGNFTQVNGSSANCLVSIDETTGNLVDTYPFLAGDVVDDFDIDGNALVAGGLIQKYNGNPVSNQLVIIDRFTQIPILTPTNSVCTGHRLGKVNKVKYINGDIYIAGNDSISSMQSHSIFKVNTSISSLTLYLSAMNFSGYISMDDFSYDDYNNTLYVTGDFTSIDIFNNVPYTGFGNNFVFAVKVDLSTNTIQNWQPLPASVYPFIPTSGVFASGGCTIGDAGPGPYDPYQDLYVYKICNLGSGIAISKGYGRYIQVYDKNTAALIDSIGWTNSILFQNNGIPSRPYQRFLDFQKAGDKLFILTAYPHASTPKCFPFETEIFEYCVPPGDLIIPEEVSNKLIFCRGSTYQFIQVRGKDVDNFQWTYTGTGATISGNGNDTISINFSYGATPGQLQVYGITACGKATNTVSLNIPFYVLPNVNAGRDTTLNCYNNKNAIVKSTSSDSNPHSLKWTGPISPVYNYSVLANTPGTYYATILDSLNLCTNIDTMQIVYDTLKPSIFCPSSYTVGCSSNTIVLNASSASMQDSLWWFVGSNNYGNPVTYIVSSSTTNATVYDKGKSNGCLNSKAVFVYFNNALPSYTIASMIYTTTVPTQFLPLTCISDSVYLSAIAASSCKLKWQLPMSTITVNNPYYATLPGIYQLQVMDTVSGCINNSFFGQILVDNVPPILTMPSSVPNINCSYNTATLIASSSTPGASIQWVAPSVGFSSANPAIASQTAWYYAIVTNTANGCAKKDSLQLTQQNILILNKSKDSTICNGSSVQITVTPAGGTPPFNYNWTGTSSALSNPIVSPAITTQYVVFVTDASSCTGRDTITITVPSVLQDSILAFTSCNPLNPAGQIQIFAYGGIPPFQYELNASTFQTGSVFLNQAYGTYTVNVKDALGCMTTNTAVISANSTAPAPDFIVNTSMMQGDTFVVVDISNPRPDSVQWLFPAGVQIINNSNSFSPVIVCSDTGYFAVTLNAFFGTCQSSLTKTVHFAKYDTSIANFKNANGIQLVNLYPNPNSGQFNIAVTLYKKQTFVIQIFDAASVEMFRIPISESSYINVPVTLPGANPGTYILKVIAEFDSKQKVFVIQ